MSHKRYIRFITRNKSAEEKFNDKLSKVNPLKADEKASYRREKKSLKERMLIFKNKWFANQGGLFVGVLDRGNTIV